MEAYSVLKDEYLKHRIDDAMGLLKQDVNRRERIDKKLWPKKYKNLDITNLYRYEITKRNYRLIYTIRGTRNTITC
jgi:mRNA-degrading endonuclease RelE of RelBE toxin-antitoxin system